MALGLQAIREALADCLRTGITGRPVTVYPYRLSSMSFPCIAIAAGEGDYVTYEVSFGTDGLSTVELAIEVHISAFNLDEQIAMDAFLSAGADNPSSIFNAVMDDPTLGGVVGRCEIRAAQGPNSNQSDPLMARLPVTIYCEKAV